MVMDMFYSYVETEKKKRVHFHGFMLDVHKSKFFGLSVPITATRGQIANSLIGMFILLHKTRNQCSAFRESREKLQCNQVDHFASLHFASLP